MVQINPPPPNRAVDPTFCDIPSDATLVRIFDPTRHNATALTFRSNGPRTRFDHHRGEGPQRTPCDDPDRAVYYAAWSTEIVEAFSSCVVEIFGDVGIVVLGDLMVAMPNLTRPMQLLDLRGSGAMRAGTVAAIAKCPHALSQPWSRYFYETEEVFGRIDGLMYSNAHNDQPAIMLYERAREGLVCSSAAIVRLDDAALRPQLIQIMRENSLTF